MPCGPRWSVRVHFVNARQSRSCVEICCDGLVGRRLRVPTPSHPPRPSLLPAAYLTEAVAAGRLAAGLQIAASESVNGATGDREAGEASEERPGEAAASVCCAVSSQTLRASCAGA